MANYTAADVKRLRELTGAGMMDSKNALAGKQLDIIRNYLLLKAVPNDLRSRIREYHSVTRG